MAEKRYSPEDERKRTADRLDSLRGKGIDARDVHPLHPGGMGEVLRQMESDPAAFRDQSQAQTERNTESGKKAVKNARKRLDEGSA
jgi:hypothetical protein